MWGCGIGMGSLVQEPALARRQDEWRGEARPKGWNELEGGKPALTLALSPKERE